MSDTAAERPAYRIALRPDEAGELDDVVVNDVEMFRAEMMDNRSLWMCCYLEGHERVNFWVRVKGRGTLEFCVTEQPHDVTYEDEWCGWADPHPPHLYAAHGGVEDDVMLYACSGEGDE